jgi:hypothetical protein
MPISIIIININIELSRAMKLTQNIPISNIRSDIIIPITILSGIV